MNIRELKPYVVYVNLDHRVDRREATEAALNIFSPLPIHRQPGIPASKITKTHGFKSPSRYACSLAKRLALRQAIHADAPCCLLIEDDVVFADNIHETLAKVDMPDKWAVIYLGCRHLRPPEICSDKLVRVTLAVDNHAMLIHRDYYGAVMKGWEGARDHRKNREEFSDIKLARALAANKHPVYALSPNLAWQRLSFSDNVDKITTNYNSKGFQTIVQPLSKQIPAPKAESKPRPFLLRRDVEAVRYLNLEKRTDRREATEALLARMNLDGRRVNALRPRDVKPHQRVSGVTLPHHACALGHLAMWEEAALGRKPTLILEDDLIACASLESEMEKELMLPEDIDILYLSITWPKAVNPPIGGVSKVGSFWGNEAYVIWPSGATKLIKKVKEYGIRNADWYPRVGNIEKWLTSRVVNPTWFCTSTDSDIAPREDTPQRLGTIWKDHPSQT